MKILSGTYEMAVGFGAGDQPPSIASTIILPKNSGYEMTHPDSWHYVRPMGGPAMSLMVTGRPWGRSSPKAEKLYPLDRQKTEEIFQFFRGIYPK